MIVAENVCENSMPALAGNAALKTTSPLVEELVIVMVESDEPRPRAISVPLINMEDFGQGWIVT